MRASPTFRPGVSLLPQAPRSHAGGFRLRGGQVVDVDPFQALFANRYLWHELIHMYIAGYIVSGFIVAGVYAYARLRGRWGRYERTALAIPLTIAALAAPVQILVGDWAARDVATTQPTKLAALEGLYHTTRGAPEHILGWYTDNQVKYGIEIPHLLSFLSSHDPNAKVEGLEACGAEVDAVSPAEYNASLLDSVWLVVAATSDDPLNRRIYADASDRRIFCNVADVPELCSFILPALHRRGPITLAVSTAGASPALAQWLRDKFAAQIGFEHEQLAGELKKRRPWAKQNLHSYEERRDYFAGLVKETLG